MGKRIRSRSHSFHISVTPENKRRRRLHSSQRDLLRSEEVEALDSLLTMGGDDAMGSNGNNAEEWKGRMIPGLEQHRLYGFPKSIITKIRYCEDLSLATSSTPSYNNFRANGLFDPDQTGIGHQPLYFDNYAAIYTRYRVLGSRIKVVWTAQQDYEDGTATPDGISSYSGPWVVGINGTNSTSAYSNTISTRMESNESTYRILNARTGADGVMVTELDFSPERQLGRPVGDDTTGSGVTGNPSGAWYFQIWAADSSASTNVIRAFVEIEYTAEFFEPANQAQN